MSVNVADNVEGWSLMVFGCDISYTFDSNLVSSIHCFYAAVLALYSIYFMTYFCRLSLNTVFAVS